MMKRTCASIAVALTAVIVVGPLAHALPKNTRVQQYKVNLDFPIDMAWVEHSKKIFFTEKNTGKVRILRKGRLLDRPCVDLAVNAQGERGALGIALDPRYDDNHFLYVFYTNAAPLENRVTRFTVRDNRCRNATHIVKGIDASASGYHNGGQLEFVRGKLFVSTGEAHDPSAAQSLSNRLGKVLRYNRDGSIPGHNPFGDGSGGRKPIWSYGHRNPFGLTHKPGGSQLFETENGPDCDDELNRIKRGQNYGWGANYRCGTQGVGSNPKPPLKRWSNVIVPTDPWYYTGRMDKLSNDIYVGDFGGNRLHRLLINDKGSDVREDRVIFNASSGITDVSKGPRGWLYFATTNGIFRIVPQ
jgi:aldose sugar dehydrogenase